MHPAPRRRYRRVIPLPSEPKPARLVRQQGAHWRLEGDLTFATVPALLGCGRELCAAQGTQLLHLDGVGRADSAALALLIEWRRLALREGFRLEFHGMPGSLRALVELSGLERLLPRNGPG